MIFLTEHPRPSCHPNLDKEKHSLVTPTREHKLCYRWIFSNFVQNNIIYLPYPTDGVGFHIQVVSHKQIK